MPRELDGVTGGSQRRSSRASSTSKTHVLDRFHAVRWFAWGLIEVRRRVQRIGDKGERPAFEPSIFRSRFLQLTRRDHLSPQQYVHLIGAISQDPSCGTRGSSPSPLYGSTRQTTRLQPGPCSRNSLRDTRSCPFRNSRLSSSCWRSGCPRSWRSTHAIASPTAGLRGQQQAGVLKRIAYGFKIPRNFEARALLICPAVA